MKRWQQTALFALCTFGTGSNAMANLAFNGTLVEPPPCTINSGSNIDIDFGNVGVSTIDGVNNLKAVNYTINCTAGTLPWALRLTVQGTATTFDSAAVQSSVTGLGIRLLRNDVPFVLNTPVLINPSSPPLLQAVPVKDIGSSLALVGFTASATLLAYYQ